MLLQAVTAIATPRVNKYNELDYQVPTRQLQFIKSVKAGGVMKLHERLQDVTPMQFSSSALIETTQNNTRP